MWINSGNGYSTSRVLLTENKLDKEGSVTSQKVKFFFIEEPIKNIWIYRWDTIRWDESDTLETSGSKLLFMVHGKGPNVTKSRKSRRNQAKIIQIESIKARSKWLSHCVIPLGPDMFNKTKYLNITSVNVHILNQFVNILNSTKISHLTTWIFVLQTQKKRFCLEKRT